MSLETLLALILFAGLLVGTPGPANILAMAAGARWGLRACAPFIIGLFTGKLLLNIMMGLGLLALLSAQPAAAGILRVLGAVYLLWLAWRITRIRLTQSSGDASAPRPGFAAGVIVHPINPKAWAMSTAAYTQFADPQANWLLQSGIITIVFLAVQMVAHPLWCFSGQKIAEKLSGSVWERVLMGGLAGSVVLLVLWSALQGGGISG